MKPKELFGVIVRGVGLYFIVFGIFRLLQIVDIVFDSVGAEFRLENRERGQIVSYVIAAAIHFAIATLFLKRGEWLVRIAYPAIQRAEDSKADEKHDG
jgi:predicted membrane protein